MSTIIAWLTGIWNVIVEAWTDLKDWIGELFRKAWDWIEETIEWFFDLVLWLPKKLFYEVMDALASIIEAIPEPGFISTFHSAAASIPASVIWGFQVVHLSEGLTMIGAAYLIRFTIRRIPIIG